MVYHHHHLYVTTSPWINHQNLKKFSVNNKELNKTSIILDHHAPNNFLLISVVAAIIYVRLHVNVPFHLIQFKMVMLHQYLLHKIVQVHHQSLHPIIVVKKFEFFIDFILSTDHLRRYIFERHFIERRTTQNTFPKLSLVILLFSFLFPLTLATQIPSTTNFDLFLLTDYALTFSLNLTTQRTPWHAGCCIRFNQTMCDAKFSSLISTHSNYTSNNTFFGASLVDTTYKYDFLNNQTLFCQRHEHYRHLTKHQLAVFTYCIVIIGIIFNTFVFLVLMRGSLRRSTSFTLFLALTCFDLLSLASSLFALLFRTVMTDLKTSPVFCKMFGIFFLYFRQCSSTTLLLIAIERCVVIKYPFCRYVFDKYRGPFLAFIMLIFAIPIPFDFIFYTSGPIHCEAFETIHAHRYQIFRGFFTVFTYAMVPFVGIAISNLIIVVELKHSRQRFMLKADDGTMKSLATNAGDKRGTTVMLFVASLAFLFLLGPFYVHWCITYLFFNYPQCQFTRNIYENVQECMGIFHPHLTIAEKGMRELNHAINFLLYMATSKHFRSDFKRIIRQLTFGVLGSGLLFLYKHICFCCPQPSCLAILERHVSDTTDIDSTYETTLKNHPAYKTAHYYSNYERRRQNQLMKATLLNNNTTVLGANLTPALSCNALPENAAKTVRTLTWNPYDPMTRQAENKRQAARLSQHHSIVSGAV